MGRACLPGPFFATVVLGALTILADGSAKQKAHYLPDIAAGKNIMTMALCEADGLYEAGSIETTAFAEKNEFIINGTKLLFRMPMSPTISCALHVTTHEQDVKKGITVFIVPAKNSGVQYTLLKTITGQKLFEVTFNNVRVTEDAVLGSAGEGWPIVERVIERAAAATLL